MGCKLRRSLSILSHPFENLFHFSYSSLFSAYFGHLNIGNQKIRQFVAARHSTILFRA